MRRIPFFILLYTSQLFGQQLQVNYNLTYSSENEKRTLSYILDIAEQKSVFRTENRKTSDSLLVNTGLGLQYYYNPDHELYLIKDLKSEKFLKKIVFAVSRDQFLIEIDERLDWSIFSETSTIAGLNCQKATVNYGGRNWTAYFTPDVAVSEGPYYFHGLPGLIVQIQDAENHFNFTATNIKETMHPSLYETGQGHKISWAQYKKQLKSYYDDPYHAVRLQGMKVVTDDGSGGYKPINFRERINENQAMLRRNNPIEINHKILFE